MADQKTVAVECHACGLVDGVVLGEQVLYNDETPEPQGTVFAECPKCQQALVAQHWFFEETWHPVHGSDGSWTPFKRVWPRPDAEISWELPDLVRDSLLEAQACLRAGACTACAAMSGRALEALCRDLNANTKNLGKGLKELLDSGKIDSRLYEWGKALNDKRNIAAHPDPRAISKRDAEYMFDFALAICDYVYVLTAKFDRFRNSA